MKDALLKYKNEGFSMRQLIILGKAYAQEIPLELIADKALTPKEMELLLQSEIDKKK